MSRRLDETAVVSRGFIDSLAMTKRPMTDEHKAALAKGRTEGRIVRDYLEGLRATKPKRGRKRTVGTVMDRLNQIDNEIATASPIDELGLVQERRDLLSELESLNDTIDIDSLEAAFVDVAKSYSDTKSIAYASWRDVGVSAAVLKRAGVTRAN